MNGLDYSGRDCSGPDFSGLDHTGLDYTGVSALVLGLGDTGLACARWLAAHGARVAVADTRAAPPGLAALKAALPEVAVHHGEFSDALLATADLLVASPGVPLATPAIARAQAAGTPVVGDIELLARAIAARDRATGTATRVLAITGSNGKSTVTAMCGQMIAAAGGRPCVAGNIGVPVLDAWLAMEAGEIDWPEVWVLELSSFQLETTTRLNATAATVLNVSEDHLDRYSDLHAYAAAKARIFAGNGVMVLNRDDARVMALADVIKADVIKADAIKAEAIKADAIKAAQPGRRSVTFGLDQCPEAGHFGRCDDDLCVGNEALLPLAALPVAGLHNAANALAALALTRALDLPMDALLAGLVHFKGLPHRVEFVAELDGVRYYDDSKGTNVGATEAALYGLGSQKAVVILGGDGKGQDFTPLVAAVRANARAVLLIGRDAARIAAALADCAVPLESFAGLDVANLHAAVARARQLAQAGDAVLLSPACASLDMFRNYHHRGEVFAAAVKALGAAKGA